MSVAISVPVKLLHEAEGHIVSLQTQTGEMFRGKLVEAEDNMNCLMRNTTVTYSNGKSIQMENVYVRGSKIVMFILPDMFKNAPMFRRFGRGRGGGRGAPGGGGGFRGGRGGWQRGRGGYQRGGYQAHLSSFQAQMSSYHVGQPSGSGGYWK